jgi:hypothetical protein
MKYFLVATSAVMGLAAPAMAFEFEFRGAEFTGTGVYGWDPVINWEVGNLGSSAEYGFGGGAFGQIDASIQGYHYPGFNAIGVSVGKHIGFEVAPDTNIAAFGTVDIFDTWPEHYILGAEVAGRMGDFSYDGYGGYLADFAGVTNQYHVEANGRYHVDDNWSAGLGGHYADLGFGATMWQAMANVRYDLMQDFSVEAGYTYSNSTFGTGQAVNLTFTKVIGGGTTFESHDTTHIYHGF